MERALTLEGGDLLVCRLGDLDPAGGQVLECSLRLTGVRPERRVAVAVALTERDDRDREYPRGVRTVAVPAHHGTEGRDIVVQPIRFILPAELDLGGADGRKLTVRADAHYIDGNERCLLTEA